MTLITEKISQINGMIRREENKQILLVIDKCFRRVTKTFLGQGNVLELGNFHKQSFAI